MPDLRELYQEIILDHNRSPRNFRKIEEANRFAEGFNPLCGDHYYIYAVVEDGVLTDVSFDGAGCAISKASASLMTETLRGKTVEEADAVIAGYRGMVLGESGAAEHKDQLGKLVVFSEVGNYPTRVKCAILAWHTLHAALHQEQDTVTTE
jgi:nitrogen fixation NifU-like protein